MASRAIHPGQAAHNTAVTVDRLFKAAFHSPSVIYQRESLCGWRPLHSVSPFDAGLTDMATSLQKPEPQTPPPGIHIRETAERFVIEIELPRIKADSLYIEISGDLLIIRGERDMESARMQKRGSPMVHRYIQLPIIARPGNVQARLEGNTVKVNIQKQARDV